MESAVGGEGYSLSDQVVQLDTSALFQGGEEGGDPSGGGAGGVAFSFGDIFGSMGVDPGALQQQQLTAQVNCLVLPDFRSLRKFSHLTN